MMRWRVLRRSTTPTRTEIARVLYVAYMRHAGFHALANEIPPLDTFPWVLADAVLALLDKKR